MRRCIALCLSVPLHLRLGTFWGLLAADEYLCAFRTNYTLSKDPDESMGIVDDAVSFVTSTMSKLKSDSSGFFTVRYIYPFCTLTCLCLVYQVGLLSIGC